MKREGNSIIDSFKYAIDGIRYSLRNERNMRIHFVVAILVLIMSTIFGLSKIELLIIYSTIAIVIITEMVNTAIEVTIDLITQEYHKLAEIAKNVAAGAVLIATMNAIIVGAFIFFDKVDNARVWFDNNELNFITLSIISITISTVLVILIKSVLKSGSPFRGGMPSGHSSIAASIVTAIYLHSDNYVTIGLSAILGLMIVQSRLDTKIHTVLEAIIGGLLGIAVTLFVFYLNTNF